MSHWQLDLLAHLTASLPDADLQPYGSAAHQTSLDGWSDLDVTITTPAPFEVEAALGSRLWAHQEVIDTDAQVVRAVLVDGRRVDLTVQGAPGLLPPAPIDNAIRFDAALAAVRFGRGSDLIGLHLTLGILQEALVYCMVGADRTTGRTHHRYATEYDRLATLSLALFKEPLGPETVMSAYALYGARRHEIEPEYEASPGGLDAVVDLGRSSCRIH